VLPHTVINWLRIPRTSTYLVRRGSWLAPRQTRRHSQSISPAGLWCGVWEMRVTTSRLWSTKDMFLQRGVREYTPNRRRSLNLPLFFRSLHLDSLHFILRVCSRVLTRYASRRGNFLPNVGSNCLGPKWDQSSKIRCPNTSSYDELDLHSWHESVDWISQTTDGSLGMAKSEWNLDLSEYNQLGRGSSFWPNVGKWGIGAILLRKWSFRYRLVYVNPELQLCWW